MQRVIHRHADQAGAQHQRHHVHAAEKGHAGHGTEQHAHQHRHERQQHAPTAKCEQQQQQNTDCGAAADPGDFPAGLLLTAGGVQQPAGGQQLDLLRGRLRPTLLQQGRDLHGQGQVKRIALRAGAQQHPLFAVGMGHQRAAADVQLHRATLRLAVLYAPGQAQPIVLTGHQAEAGEGVEQRLNPLLNEGVRVRDQLFAVGGREHRQSSAQQLFAQRREIGLQVPLHLFKQAAGLPLLPQLLGHVDGLLTIRTAHQHQHFAVQWLLHTLFGAQLQRVGGVAGHQRHQVGR